MNLNNEIDISGSTPIFIDLRGILKTIYDNVSHESIVEFITVLEKDYYSDWSVSEDLYKHYKEQHKKFLNIVAVEDSLENEKESLENEDSFENETKIDK